MSLVWANGPLPPHQRLMMLALADNANDRGLSWPSVSTLAQKCSVKERAAQYTLQSLQSDGWLSIEERPGRSNYYRVNVDRLTHAMECTPATDCTGAAEEREVVQPTAPEPSMNHQEVPTPPTPRKRGRLQYTPDFEEFWEAYPRKVDKQGAARAWEKVRALNIDRRTVIIAATQLAVDPNREDRYTPHAATWLRRDGWLEGPLPPRSNGRPTGNDIATAAYSLAERLDGASLRRITS